MHDINEFSDQASSPDRPVDRPNRSGDQQANPDLEVGGGPLPCAYCKAEAHLRYDWGWANRAALLPVCDRCHSAIHNGRRIGFQPSASHQWLLKARGPAADSRAPG